jgi:hypothetical protein
VLQVRNVSVVEQAWCSVEGMSEEEAKELIQLGRTMRGSGRRPGQADDDGEEDGVDTESSVIDVRRTPGDRMWQVFVHNSVGVIGVDDLQILVEPKIDRAHFVHLVQLATDPANIRLGQGDFLADSSPEFLASVWIAYLDALAVTLRADLHHDYVETGDDPPYIRGRLDLVATSVNLARGRLRFPSTFDELSADNPVNRVLKAACNHVAVAAARIASGADAQENHPQVAIHRAIARRARESVYRLEQAGDLRIGDVDAPTPRLALHQSRALGLARHVLSGVGRDIRLGNHRVSCFLYRTPPIAESAVRNLLAGQLGQGITVTKRSRRIQGLEFNPDLVVSLRNHGTESLLATGDVKYQVRGEHWPRSVLQQAVVFGQVFGARQAFFVDFSSAESAAEPRMFVLNGVKYHRFSWAADAQIRPDSAAQQLLDDIQHAIVHSPELSAAVS